MRAHASTRMRAPAHAHTPAREQAHQDIDAEKITKPLSFTRALFSCLILSPRQQAATKGNIVSPLLNSIVSQFPAPAMVTACAVTKELYGYSSFVFDETKFKKLWYGYIHRLPFNQQCSIASMHNEARDIARDKVEFYLSHI
jgi:hypothetical protein